MVSKATLRFLKDEELMQRYCEGELLAFDELYERHKGRVMAYIKKKSTSEHHDDLFQLSFAKLHQKRFLYKSEMPFLPWFYTLIKNSVIDLQRKEGRHREGLSKVSQDFEPLDNSSDGETSDLENSEVLEGLDLNQEQYQLLYKKFVEGKNYKELELELNSNAGALRKRVSRLLKALRRGRAQS